MPGCAGGGARRLTSAASQYDGASGPPGGAPGDRSPCCRVAPSARGDLAPLAKSAALGRGRGRPALGGYSLAPTVETMLNTISTDDAYVNSHVTYVAPRVAGQVSRVLADDNDRVKKGDLLVELDKEPYQVQVDLKKAAVVNAEADLVAARAQVRGTLAQARGQRWKLQRAIEDVDDTVAKLRARVATLRSKEATFDRAGADLLRARALYSRNAMSREEFDKNLEQERTAEAAVKQALEEVHETRVALGLTPHPEGAALTDVPADLNQTFSGVRQALDELVQSMAQVGLPLLSTSQRPSRRSRSSSGATRRGTSIEYWSGWCRRPQRSDRPRPSCSRPGVTSPRPS